MAKDQKRSLKREFSAGGVVYKRVVRESRVSQVPRVEWLIGKHSGYHKWVLPKGLIEEGERGLETALREVEEEMGVRARPVTEKPISKTEYFFWAELKTKHSTRRVAKYQEEGGKKTRVSKSVSFYLLEYVSGNVKNHGWEMEEARWLPYGQARRLLAFEGEKEALKVAHEAIQK